MMNAFLKTDQRQDVLSSLKMTITAMDLAQENLIYWKWVILALHSALQGAMVCHLNRSDGFGASKDVQVKKWYNWHDSGREGKEPVTQLATPPDLFKWIADSSRNPGNEIWKPIEMTESRQSAFDQLHELRNPFTHFQPMLWSIEIAGLPKMVCELVEIIDEIYQIGWGFLNLEEADKELFCELIKSLKLQSQQ